MLDIFAVDPKWPQVSWVLCVKDCANRFVFKCVISSHATMRFRLLFSFVPLLFQILFFALEYLKTVSYISKINTNRVLMFITDFLFCFFSNRNEHLHRCSQCKVAKYCGKSCQVRWKITAIKHWRKTSIWMLNLQGLHTFSTLSHLQIFLFVVTDGEQTCRLV